MIIWKGWGLIGLLPILVATIIITLIAQHGVHERGDGPETGTFLCVCAAGIWWLGRWLNRGTRWHESRHSLYTIPLQYYAIPLAAAGVILAVASLLAPA